MIFNDRGRKKTGFFEHEDIFSSPLSSALKGNTLASPQRFQPYDGAKQYSLERKKPERGLFDDSSKRYAFNLMNKESSMHHNFMSNIGNLPKLDLLSNDHSLKQASQSFLPDIKYVKQRKYAGELSKQIEERERMQLEEQPKRYAVQSDPFAVIGGSEYRVSNYRPSFDLFSPPSKRLSSRIQHYKDSRSPILRRLPYKGKSFSPNQGYSTRGADFYTAQKSRNLQLSPPNQGDFPFRKPVVHVQLREFTSPKKYTRKGNDESNYSPLSDNWKEGWKRRGNNHDSGSMNQILPSNSVFEPLPKSERDYEQEDFENEQRRKAEEARRLRKEKERELEQNRRQEEEEDIRKTQLRMQIEKEQKRRQEEEEDIRQTQLRMKIEKEQDQQEDFLVKEREKLRLQMEVESAKRKQLQATAEDESQKALEIQKQKLKDQEMLLEKQKRQMEEQKMLLNQQVTTPKKVSAITQTTSPIKVDRQLDNQKRSPSGGNMIKTKLISKYPPIKTIEQSEEMQMMRDDIQHKMAQIQDESTKLKEKQSQEVDEESRRKIQEESKLVKKRPDSMGQKDYADIIEQLKYQQQQQSAIQKKEIEAQQRMNLENLQRIAQEIQKKEAQEEIRFQNLKKQVDELDRNHNQNLLNQKQKTQHDLLQNSAKESLNNTPFTNRLKSEGIEPTGGSVNVFSPTPKKEKIDAQSNGISPKGINDPSSTTSKWEQGGMRGSNRIEKFLQDTQATRDKSFNNSKAMQQTPKTDKNVVTNYPNYNERKYVNCTLQNDREQVDANCVEKRHATQNDNNNSLYSAGQLSNKNRPLSKQKRSASTNRQSLPLENPPDHSQLFGSPITKKRTTQPEAFTQEIYFLKPKQQAQSKQQVLSKQYELPKQQGQPNKLQNVIKDLDSLIGDLKSNKFKPRPRN